MEIRNIAIIAHVDHGKTTLTDALMKQAGVLIEGTTMDSNDLEKERGITIYSKNTSIIYKDVKINIVDTPGHADFGSEVERVLRSIDSVLLVVDAQEGPMPQTRFVLKKSLELGINPIVLINKIDKNAANPSLCHDQVLELFWELGANEKQANFPVVYTIGRLGIAKNSLDEKSEDLKPLLETIIKHVPNAADQTSLSKDLMFQPFNLAYDNFLGRMAIGRVYQGSIKQNSSVFVKNSDGKTRAGKLTKIFSFEGIERKETTEIQTGDIALVAGIPDINIGETITTNADATPLPAIAIDEPTITLNFLVNNSPFAGKDGKFITSRQLREYLERELEVNVGLHVDFSKADSFKVSGRGELHIAILLENMRRAGYELQISQPHVIIKEEKGQKLEPFEELIIDCPQEYQGVIIERLGNRAFFLKNIFHKENAVRLFFEGPTRGFLGYRNQFVIDTKGEGILSSRVIGFFPYAGEIKRRSVDSMISMSMGKALSFALWMLQERGLLYIGPGVDVYEGQVVGNTSKGIEMMVNPTKNKAMSNFRNARNDEEINLNPPYELTIERGFEIMAGDEFLEITPKNVRLRKELLTEVERTRNKRQKNKE
ncbi:MAG: GTP-binding protein TypA [Candidatus Brennerbacteria bacterium RIFOXYC1_FULL_41_11]|uniref:50S ribosomal subunit assembly factor BipA n=1 Tax=Candidatus Brennerbacteria bacterium RIFOXYD1_FULL_41_16 TaxID=1797529 RepID=A0A1G1XK61_9BACT|nr:MAG: GTP-binding protein TypA/BipA [Parcubacteria group bacterium GW2011_GWB1_41_4]OGY39315.1 MAG: GTP-binding protein TypA [Candidatus Brennerbacteria bacterium RIFOXYB1_FULL_41_13]OGY39718.1 MAG: GTP-binding protein TypA [Candidatus Brennerbacteria bacterium RIFOXYC1_FULL_41_11]OGY40342.1 MAG: GTP-binding protein TypA [Candidatus Brennerbacteria bacterium RIFOXYD1_FULL_41_16]